MLEIRNNDEMSLHGGPIDIDLGSSDLCAEKSRGKIVWVNGVAIGGAEAVVMAGPCSVETRSQIFETAYAVKARGAR